MSHPTRGGPARMPTIARSRRRWDRSIPRPRRRGGRRRTSRSPSRSGEKIVGCASFECLCYGRPPARFLLAIDHSECAKDLELAGERFVIHGRAFVLDSLDLRDGDSRDAEESRVAEMKTAAPGAAPMRNISDTALWAAVYRGRETQRHDGLFRDPFARRLAGERGAQIAAGFRSHDRSEWAWVMRTVLFDRFVQEGIAQGVDLVLNLAAGLDARPYRMP